MQYCLLFKIPCALIKIFCTYYYYYLVKCYYLLACRCMKWPRCYLQEEFSWMSIQQRWLKLQQSPMNYPHLPHSYKWGQGLRIWWVWGPPEAQLLMLRGPTTAVTRIKLGLVGSSPRRMTASVMKDAASSLSRLSLRIKVSWMMWQISIFGIGAAAFDEVDLVQLRTMICVFISSRLPLLVSFYYVLCFV